MVDDVQDEAKADVARAERRVTARVSAIGERVTDEAESLPGAQFVVDYVERHPMTSVVAGLGLGIALGMMSEGFSDDDDDRDELAEAKRRRDQARKRRRSGSSSSSSFAGLSRMLAGPSLSMVTGPLREEAGLILQQVVEGLKGGGNGPSGQPDRAADVRRQSMQGAERSGAAERAHSAP